MTDSTTPVTPFKDLGLSPSILSFLEKNNIPSPTPIQGKSIPVALQGTDVIGIAQTGTGKTYAFGLPMIRRLAMHKGRGLIILPTRELALQVDEALKKVGAPLGMRTAVLIGGESIDKQRRALKEKPHVLIVTPGRLIDHLENRTVDLREVKILVLDEADRMLDMGFAPQIDKILKVVPKDRQTLLFSATMPDQIVSIAKNHMKMPVRIEIAKAGTTAEKIDQEIFIVDKNRKLNLLKHLLQEFTATVLVFSRIKHGAKKICKSVNAMGHRAAEIHANRSLAQRKEALAGFKDGKYRVLIATDIAARGIDVKNIGVVINFDLPDNTDDYVHRIGRTGRAGQKGHAISFATPDQRSEILAIERLIRMKVTLSKVPLNLPDVPQPAAEPYAPRPMSRSPRSGGRPAPRTGSSVPRTGSAPRPSTGSAPRPYSAAHPPARYGKPPARPAAPRPNLLQPKPTPRPTTPPSSSSKSFNNDEDGPTYRYEPRR